MTAFTNKRDRLPQLTMGVNGVNTENNYRLSHTLTEQNHHDETKAINPFFDANVGRMFNG